MKLTAPQRLILYSLGQFYQSLNQPLFDKSLRLQTSKIAFIELLERSGLLSKHERALYKNLAAMERRKLIAYESKMIQFTDKGLKELQRINDEVQEFKSMENYFQQGEKPRRKLQTVIRSP